MHTKQISGCKDKGLTRSIESDWINLHHKVLCRTISEPLFFNIYINGLEEETFNYREGNNLMVLYSFSEGRCLG